MSSFVDTDTDGLFGVRDQTNGNGSAVDFAGGGGELGLDTTYLHDTQNVGDDLTAGFFIL